eukprot:gene6697-biopygen8792
MASAILETSWTFPAPEVRQSAESPPEVRQKSARVRWKSTKVGEAETGKEEGEGRGRRKRAKEEGEGRGRRKRAKEEGEGRRRRKKA